MASSLPNGAENRAGLQPRLAAILRCPECLGDLEEGDSALRCRECASVVPVRDRVPFAFVRSDQARFLSLDDKRLESGVRRRPRRYRGGAYHWGTYGFEALLPPLSGGLALLHGCGDAGEREPLERHGFEVLGFDIRRSPGTDFLADAHRLPLAADSLDLVLSTQVLEHLTAPWKAAAEIERVLRPGGWFLGSVAFLKPFHESYFHMSHKGIVTLLESSGLTVDRLVGAQSLTYSMYGAMVPLGNRRFKRAAIELVDRLLMGARARAWALRRHRSPDEPTEVFDRRFRFSFREFDKLRYAPAVVFRARKSEPESSRAFR